MAKLDVDIKGMSLGQRGNEIQRLREIIRSHKRKENSSSRRLADVELYNRALPEGAQGAGRMDLSR